jgi:Uma2 family endonuclease
MHAHSPIVVTEAEFLALPESMEKVELLDGEIIVAPAPSLLHQDILGRLVFALRVWALNRLPPVFIGQSPIDIRFAPGRILQPDAFVLFGKVDPRHVGPLDQIPDLCIEVRSPSDRGYDRFTKRLAYAAAGVREYWLVYLDGPVERWHGPSLERAEEHGEVLTSPLLPELSLDVRSLFPDSEG